MKTRTAFSIQNLKLDSTVKKLYTNKVQLKPDNENKFWSIIFKILRDNDITKENEYDIDLLTDDLFGYMNFSGKHEKYKTWKQTIDYLIKLINDPDYDLTMQDEEDTMDEHKMNRTTEEQKLRKIIRNEIEKILNDSPKKHFLYNGA